MLKAVVMFMFGLLKSLRYFPLRWLEIFGQIFPENSFGCTVRGWLYRPFMKSCGKNFQVGLAVKLEHCNNINVGNHVYIGHGSWISGLRGGVTLEDEVLIGPHVRMVSSNHTFSGGSSRFAPGVGGAIVIGKGTWIASGASIMAGVSVGDSCLVAASAVVTKEVVKDTIVAGVPAKRIGSVSAKYVKSSERDS
jgi:maltose O-acetyltransferase